MFNLFKKTLTEEQVQQLDQTVEKFKQNPHQFLFTVIFFITSIVFGVLSIYLLQQKFALLMKQDGKVEIKEIIKNVPVPPEDVLAPTEEATESADVRSTDWTIEKGACGVLTPISPYQSVYTVEDKDANRYWANYVLKIGNDFPNAFLNIFDQESISVFSAQERETENTPAIIRVSCAKKQLKDETLEDLREKIDYQLENNEELKGVSIISSLEKKVWGKDTLELVFSGGNLDGKIFYAVASNEYFYLVNKEVNLNDEVVKQDANRIFNGLIFLD